MQVLVITRDAPGASWENREGLLRDEALHVWWLQKQNVIRDIWFTEPVRDAVILMECEGLDGAKAVLDKLPLVSAGLITYTVMGLTAYDGFERLFER